jgi:penicillin-binding protein 1A
MPTRRWFTVFLATITSLVVLFLAVTALTVALIYPKLPGMQTLTDYRPKVPMRVYTLDGALIAEFGEEHRAIITLAQTPKILQQAILAAEDDRFYQHGAIDVMGVLRAALTNLVSGGAKEGASTITMQVARNFFLSSEKTLTRKLNEALLSFKIEKNLTKNQILTLYINQIYLGQRAYGFAAASQAYFGKPISKLTLGEAAMLAGLPKAPSKYNPAVNLPRALERQHYVLHRMLELKYITEAQYQAAMNQILVVRKTPTIINSLNADYVAEMIRQAMYDRYQDAIYSNGLKVYTTLLKRDQIAADNALWSGVEAYDHRHGYRGPESSIDLSNTTNSSDVMISALQNIPDVHDLIPAVVITENNKLVRAYAKNTGNIDIVGGGLSFAQRALTHPDRRIDGQKITLHRGDIIRVQRGTDGAWSITQLPQAEAALVSLNPETGAIRALVGGYDYDLNKFNHVTQAWRQPGSSFKPFIYSAALEKGFTPASLIEDTPVDIPADQTGGVLWQPKDYENTYSGTLVSMRNALTHSLNLPTIRILQTITPTYAQDYVQRFGFDAQHIPPYLTMGLGAGSVTPLQMASAYAIFANGGEQITPYIIDHITDQNGQIISSVSPQAPKQVIDPRNAFIMTSLMQDVVRRGTGARASELGRSDLAGKTGTTNDQRDAWFAGFQPSLVTVAWIGFDQPRSLGGGETGAQAALPIWMKYMGEALKGVPQATINPPQGVVSVSINPLTGLPTEAGEQGTPEYFYQEVVPIVTSTTPPGNTNIAPFTPSSTNLPH